MAFYATLIAPWHAGPKNHVERNEDGAGKSGEPLPAVSGCVPLSRGVKKAALKKALDTCDSVIVMYNSIASLREL
jgi:hypothetical protein